jgi:hypothetical protein
MNTALQRVVVASVMCASCGAALAQAGDRQPADKCEAAVAQTVKRMRGVDSQAVQFTPASRAISREPGADEVGVKGAGRYRGREGTPVPFTYSCAFNTKTGATSGAMFRETASAPAPDNAAWQPDLSRLSPEACESATAAALKDKHPRADHIVFDSSSRQLEPVATLTALQGRGALMRAPGVKSTAFTYRCEYDTAGKVVRVETGD